MVVFVLTSVVLMVAEVSTCGRSRTAFESCYASDILRRAPSDGGAGPTADGSGAEGSAGAGSGEDEGSAAEAQNR